MTGLNVALTVRSPPRVRVQVFPDIESQPDQLAKVEPDTGAAVSVTAVPAARVAEQVPPQLIPFPVTVPEPEPALLTVRT